MPERYPVPAREHSVQETIRKSRFITTLAAAADSEAARAFIDRIRSRYPDATHHCWAFVAGPPGSTGALGLSDDGEPHGTAGRPILNALQHSGLGEVAAVVTRYYGGVKLGRGGLARAYAGGVLKAIETLPTLERVSRVRLEIELDYAEVDALRRLLEDCDARIDEETYGEAVLYRVAVPEGREAALAEGLAALTAGRGRIRPLR